MNDGIKERLALRIASLMLEIAELQEALHVSEQERIRLSDELNELELIKKRADAMKELETIAINEEEKGQDDGE